MKNSTAGRITLGVLGGNGLQVVIFDQFGSRHAIDAVKHWEEHGDSIAYIDDCTARITAVRDEAVTPERPNTFRIEAGDGLTISKTNPNYCHLPYFEAFELLKCLEATGEIDEKGYATVSFLPFPDVPTTANKFPLPKYWLAIVNEKAPLVLTERGPSRLIEVLFGKKLTPQALEIFGSTRVVHIDGRPLRAEITAPRPEEVTIHLTPVGDVQLLNGDPQVMGEDLLKCSKITVCVPLELNGSSSSDFCSILYAPS